MADAKMGSQAQEPGVRHRDAIELAKKVLACNLASPHSQARAAFVMGSIAVQLGYDEQGEQWFKAAIAKNPRHSMAHTNLADLRVRQNRPSEALWQARRAIIADPGNAAAYYNAGSAHAIMKDWDMSRVHFTEALRAAQSTPQPQKYIAMMAQLRLGQTEVEAGHKEAAEAHFRKAMEIDGVWWPDMDDALVGLAQLLNKDGRSNEVLGMLQAAHRRTVNNSNIDNQLASAYFETGDLKAACKVMRKIYEYGGSKDGGHGVRRCDLQAKAEVWLAKFVPPQQPPAEVPVPRRKAAELSFREFYEEFATKSKPVVIEGAAYRMNTGEPWTADFIDRHCGSKPVLLKKRSRRDLGERAQSWGDLEETVRVNISDVVNRVFRGKPAEAGASWDASSEFVFDWSLNQFCPELTSHYVVPKYFASDFLQRVPPDVAGNLTYRDTWPSLFLQPGGTRSGLHVDSFGSNFFLALLRGRKKWVFFDREEMPLLYPNYLSQGFAMSDAMEPDYDRFPNLRHATRHIAEIGPGDVVFVPAGSAHQVNNLEACIAVSMNYIDGSNMQLAKEELHDLSLMGGKETAATESLLRYFELDAFNDTVDLDQPDLGWQDFKNGHLRWPTGGAPARDAR